VLFSALADWKTLLVSFVLISGSVAILSLSLRSGGAETPAA
jgi:hypothetical protein